jgi:hypothetical protein
MTTKQIMAEVPCVLLGIRLNIIKASVAEYLFFTGRKCYELPQGSEGASVYL